MATVLLAILLGLAALLLLLVWVPFQVRAAGALTFESVSGEALAQWGWGLLQVRLSSSEPGRGLRLRALGIPVRIRRHRREAAEEAPEDEPEEETRSRARRRPRLEQPGRLIRMAGRALGALHLRLRVNGVVGTGDPAQTAVLLPLLGQLERLSGVELDLEWDWLEERLELEAEGSARIWIAELLWTALALLLVRENRAVLRALRGTV
jgi:hypothetical protein